MYIYSANIHSKHPTKHTVGTQIKVARAQARIAPGWHASARCVRVSMSVCVRNLREDGVEWMCGCVSPLLPETHVSRTPNSVRFVPTPRACSILLPRGDGSVTADWRGTNRRLTVSMGRGFQATVSGVDTGEGESVGVSSHCCVGVSALCCLKHTSLGHRTVPDSCRHLGLARLF